MQDQILMSTNSFYNFCLNFFPLLMLITVVALIVFIVLLAKSKKPVFIIPIIFVFIFGNQALMPIIHEGKATIASDYLGEYQKAIKATMFPAYKGILYAHLGDRYAMDGNRKKAIEAYETAYKYTKSYKVDSIWFIASETYYKEGNFDKVIEISNGTGIVSNLPGAYIMKGDFEKALDAANKLIKKDPKWYNAYGIRANIYVNLNMPAEARQDYEKALEMSPCDGCTLRVQDEFYNKDAIKEQWSDLNLDKPSRYKK